MSILNINNFMLVLTIPQYQEIIEPILRENNWETIPNTEIVSMPAWQGPFNTSKQIKITFNDPQEETFFKLKYL